MARHGAHAPAGHVMSALSHTMGGDLDLSAMGGIAVVTGAEQTRQALLRRLCTNVAAYIWQPDYGAGLPARVGAVLDEAGIRALVLEQAQSEAGIDPSQPVTVTITNPRVGAHCWPYPTPTPRPARCRNLRWARSRPNVIGSVGGAGDPCRTSCHGHCPPGPLHVPAMRVRSRLYLPFMPTGMTARPGTGKPAIPFMLQPAAPAL